MTITAPPSSDDGPDGGNDGDDFEAFLLTVASGIEARTGTPGHIFTGAELTALWIAYDSAWVDGENRRKD